MTRVRLNPDKTGPLEPSLGDDRNGSWILPTEIPRAILLGGDPELLAIRVVKFDYVGGETGDTWIPLDDLDEPPVMIRVGSQTKKILELTFGSTIAFSDLPRIGERLNRLAPKAAALSTRFNYEMIARIFTEWSQVAEPAD